MTRLKTLGTRMTNTLPNRVRSSAPSSAGITAVDKGTTTQRGYGWTWQKLRLQILQRDAGLCQPCLRRGRVTPNCNTVDHIHNKARGGRDEEANLQTICSGPGSCHQKKTQAESRGETWDETSC